MDESGARTVATVTVSGPADAALEQKLNEAFKTYEFTTKLVFSGR